METGFDVLPGLRTRERERRIIGADRLLHLRLAELRLLAEIPLVREELDRDLPRDAVHALDPVVQVVESRFPRDVAHRDDPLRAVEVRFLEEFAEALLPHDVPDCHVDLQLGPPVGMGHRELLLRDLRAEGLDVLIIEVVEYEPADQRRLTARRLTDEAYFHLHPADVPGGPFRCNALTRAGGYKRSPHVIKRESFKGFPEDRQRSAGPPSDAALILSKERGSGAADAMCDEYWERELARRWKLLATEDEMKSLPVIEDEDLGGKIEPVVLPPSPVLEEKKPLRRMLAH